MAAPYKAIERGRKINQFIGKCHRREVTVEYPFLQMSLTVLHVLLLPFPPQRENSHQRRSSERREENKLSHSSSIAQKSNLMHSQPLPSAALS
mmetsp:Transcript_32653/g.45537  ORF Transcript_32653/g.45537 Transcript_32653/m.45537 type:complete len:93 (+) Transcript_32653:500-778(+)